MWGGSLTIRLHISLCPTCTRSLVVSVSSVWTQRSISFVVIFRTASMDVPEYYLSYARPLRSTCFPFIIQYRPLFCELLRGLLKIKVTL
jgi:hypothetical protein